MVPSSILIDNIATSLFQGIYEHEARKLGGIPEINSTKYKASGNNQLYYLQHKTLKRKQPLQHTIFIRAG